jgi:CubicO group peptidase (beta-lactamase class C family)
MSARRLIGTAVCVMMVGTALVQSNTALAQTTTTLPTTGPAVASFAAFESQFQSYMQRNSFTGANVAVSVRSAAGNVVIYERGFGFADRARTVLMTPRAPMRIASVSKAFTRAALQTL